MDTIIIYDIFSIKKKCTLQQIIIYYYFMSPSKYTAECEEGSTEAFSYFTISCIVETDFCFQIIWRGILKAYRA